MVAAVLEINYMGALDGGEQIKDIDAMELSLYQCQCLSITRA